MAAAVLFLSPGRKANARLALLLFFEGVTWGTGTGAMYLTDQEPAAFGAQALFVTGILFLPVAYLLFLETLDTPLVRWLRPWPVRGAIVAAGLGAEAYWLAHPAVFIPGMVPVWYAPWEAVLGDVFLGFWKVRGAVSIFAIAAALDAHRRAHPGTPARDRTRSYAVAFVTRDAWQIMFTLLLPLVVPPPPSGTPWDLVSIDGTALVVILFVALLAHGILRTQLFDIDLRLRLGVRRGTLAAVFLAVFFIVAQLAQNFLSASYGWALGGIAAGLLLFALAPLQRLAERIADAALPGATGTPEYLSFRKLQVYQAALEGAYEDGEVTPKERAMLERLPPSCASTPARRTRSSRTRSSGSPRREFPADAAAVGRRRASAASRARSAARGAEGRAHRERGPDPSSPRTGGARPRPRRARLGSWPSCLGSAS